MLLASTGEKRRGELGDWDMGRGGKDEEREEREGEERVYLGLQCPQKRK